MLQKLIKILRMAKLSLILLVKSLPLVQVNEQATRGARLLLDIEAASPILLIPHSSETHAVLVADLGNLKLRNKFIVDGETGTLRAQTERDGAKVYDFFFSSSSF